MATNKPALRRTIVHRQNRRQIERSQPPLVAYASVTAATIAGSNIHRSR